MLNIDNATSGPVTLQVTFGQWVKAGAGFALGASAIAMVCSVVTMIAFKFLLLGLVLRLL